MTLSHRLFKLPNPLVCCSRFGSIIVLCTALLFCAAPLVSAQEAESQDTSGGETEEKAGGEQKAGGEALARFLLGRVGDFIKSGNVFFPGADEGGEGQAEGKGDDKVTVNFNNADIKQILKFVSDQTGKVVIKSDEVNGNLTIIMPEPVTKEEALRKIETAMALKNFTFVETDGMLLALTFEQAVKAGVPVGTGDVDALSPRLDTRFITLKYADAVRVKEAITPILTNPERVVADPRTNQLIITDTGANIVRVQKIVEQLDREDEGTRIVTKIVKLNYANAQQLSQALKGLLGHLNSGGIGDGQGGRRGRPGGDSAGAGLTTEIFADQITNSLIISGPQPDVDTVLEFIQELDTSTSEGMETKTFKLTHTSAQELATEINQLLQTKRSGFRQPVVVADRWTNALLVTGFPEDIEFVSQLVAELDHVKISDRNTRVFQLKHADAAVLSQAISQVLGEGNNSGGRRYYYYFSGRGGGDDDEGIKIYEDLRTNSLIISAKVEDFEMIEELIDSLDVELDEGKEEPRVFPLKFADASSLAQLLEDLFEDDSFDYWWSDTRKASVSALAGKVRVIPDISTNSLVVIASTPRAFEVVKSLLVELDVDSQFGSNEVISLKNAKATEVAEYLNELFQDNEQGGGGNRGFFWFLSRSMGGEREISNLIGNVRVVAEPRTNSLLVITQQQNIRSIKELVERLDKATAQVLVEILIVEISSLDDDDLGIQWGGSGDMMGRTELNVSGEGVYQNFTSNANSSLNRFNYATLSDSQFGVVLNYLTSNSKANVIARPNIMTSNNEPALVQLQQRVPYVQDVQFNNNTSNVGVEYENVGLVLSVTPQINIAQVETDERVTLEVTLENGEVLDNMNTLSVQGQGQTVELVAFSQRVVNTNITVDNGMTVVLSGVLDERTVEDNDGVPGLRRIPVFGRLFQNKSKRKEKTELITFITPYILSTPEEIAEITERQMRSEGFQNLMIDEGLSVEGLDSATKTGKVRDLNTLRTRKVEPGNN